MSATASITLYLRILIETDYRPREPTDLVVNPLIFCTDESRGGYTDLLLNGLTHLSCGATQMTLKSIGIIGAVAFLEFRGRVGDSWAGARECVDR